MACAFLAGQTWAAALPTKYEIAAGSNIATINTGIAGTSVNSKAFGSGTSSGVDNTSSAFLKDSTKNILVTVDSTAGQTAHNLDWTISKVFFTRKAPTIGMWVYFTDATKWQNCSVFITPNSYTDYFSASFIGIRALRSGWNFYQLHKDDFSVGGGSPVWTSTMTTMRLQCTGVNGQIGTLYVDQNYTEFYSRPHVVFTFDGNNLTTHSSAYPILAGHHWKGSLYLSGNSLATGGFLSNVQIQELADAGWDLLSHTQTSPDLTTLNAAQIQSELSTAEASLAAQGFALTGKHLAYPSGSFNTAVQDAVAAAGYLTGADASGMTQAPISTAKGFDSGFYRVVRVGLDSGVSLAQAKAEVDQVIKRGGSTVFLIHNLAGAAGSLQWASADLQSLSDYIARFEPQVTVDTLHNWYRGYHGSRRVR